MNKIPRFMREYARHEIMAYKGAQLMDDFYKMEAIKSINVCLQTYGRGMITINEAMDWITHPFR